MKREVVIYRLRTPVICNHSVGSRDKNEKKKCSWGSPENETLGELTSHFNPTQCNKKDCTTTMKWLVAGADLPSELLSRLICANTSANRKSLPSYLLYLLLKIRPHLYLSFHIT